MHLLVIFLQYLLGRLSNQPQPTPVAIPVRQPTAEASPDHQAFESMNGPPGPPSIFYGSTETGTPVPGLGRSARNTALWAVALLSAACLGPDRPENSSQSWAVRACALCS